MKVFCAFLFVSICCVVPVVTAQNPQQQFWSLNQNKLLLDQVKSTNASMAYSIRRLRSVYTGPAIRVRKGTGTAIATADVSFNPQTGTVHANSIVTIITAGSGSGYTVGSTMTFSSFYGTSSVYVSTWYDQSGNARHAVQSTESQQPRIVNSGTLETSNAKASILFTGLSLTVLQATAAATSVFGSGYIGTAASVLEASPGTTSAFGYEAGTARWQCHINWAGTLYLDVGNPYARIMASNSANEGLLRNYMLIASATAPTLRIMVSGTSVGGTISGTPATLPASATTFNVGGTAAASYHSGHQSELVIFPVALAAAEMNIVNKNQRLFFNTP